MHGNDRIVLFLRATHEASPFFCHHFYFRLLIQVAPVIAHPVCDHVVDDRVNLDRDHFLYPIMQGIEDLCASATADDQHARARLADVSDIRSEIVTSFKLRQDLPDVRA